METKPARPLLDPNLSPTIRRYRDWQRDWWYRQKNEPLPVHYVVDRMGNARRVGDVENTKDQAPSVEVGQVVRLLSGIVAIVTGSVSREATYGNWLTGVVLTRSNTTGYQPGELYRFESDAVVHNYGVLTNDFFDGARRDLVRQKRKAVYAKKDELQQKQKEYMDLLTELRVLENEGL